MRRPHLEAVVVPASEQHVAQASRCAIKKIIDCHATTRLLGQRYGHYFRIPRHSSAPIRRSVWHRRDWRQTKASSYNEASDDRVGMRTGLGCQTGGAVLGSGPVGLKMWLGENPKCVPARLTCRGGRHGKLNSRGLVRVIRKMIVSIPQVTCIPNIGTIASSAR